MTESEHIELLGKLVMNLQAVEGAIRHFLHLHNGSAEPKVDLEKVREGDLIVVNSVTDYDSLRELVKRFNDLCKSKDLQISLPSELVTLRDAIAHGRVLSRVSRPPLRISKFSRPHEQHVEVEYHQTMNREWFGRNLALTTDCIKALACASQELNPSVIKNC